MTATISCPACSSSVPADDAWCEACGAELPAAAGSGPASAPARSDGTDETGSTPSDPATSPAHNEAPGSPPTPEQAAEPWPAPCVSCHAAKQDVTTDGWCTMCGQRQPTQQDHAEIDAGVVAAVTDRGLRHHRNEDAVAIAEREHGAIIVVCDGVSSTELPDEGAKAACDAALAVLVDHWDARFGPPAGTAPSEAPPVDQTNPDDAAGFDGLAPWMEEAAGAANDAIATVIASAGELTGEPPSCTMVAAAARIRDDQVTIWVGWLGDSRAYWVSGLDGQLLTVDHSWAALQDERGELDAEAIAADPRANSITRWVGPDSPNNRAEVRRFDFAIPGRLIVCSDGLWRYADKADDMALRSAEAGDAPIDAARSLADLALTSGGHDNISVAVFDAGTHNVLAAIPDAKE